MERQRETERGERERDREIDRQIDRPTEGTTDQPGKVDMRICFGGLGSLGNSNFQEASNDFL